MGRKWLPYHPSGRQFSNALSAHRSEIKQFVLACQVTRSRLSCLGGSHPAATSDLISSHLPPHQWLLEREKSWVAQL